jgi:carbamoyl-phosphate synthase large subunit
MKIAISGLNNTDNPAPGIGVAKSLKDRYSLIGLSYDPNEPGVYQGLFERVYLMPYPTLGYE